MLDLLRGRGLEAYKSRDALTYLFNIFTLVGTNPQGQQSNKYYYLYYLYSVTVNFICCFFSPLSFHIGYIKYLNVLSTTELLAAIQNAVQVTGIPVKIIVITWHMKSLLSAREILDELDANYRRADDLLRIRQCVRRCCKIIVIFCVPYYSFEITTIAFGVLQHRVPLAAWVPYLDAQGGAEWQYWTIVVWDTFVMFILLTHQLASDTYPPVYISIIRTHIQLLVERAKRLGGDRMLNADENYAELLACIRTHCQILRLARIVAPVISITLFTQFATTAITVLNWFGNVEFPENIISFAFFSCQLMQILPCCYCASLLIDDCDQLPNAIFHSNWMDQNRRYRKTILFFIQRTQNPIRFSCLKLFGVNLATGMAIGKFAFSLYTFIKESKVGDKLDK
ncbi:PREDICTED: odorant receptor 42b-like [Rhagoletis zephyria]|uniref:odorant receptor 42b-like n=1 Tax=Rhagoletis zephyria TaxID=28612 RepID=UPI0008114270|nr:PREDICTED: odorant receptor 42b-like [Rhagoletis zephyria]